MNECGDGRAILISRYAGGGGGGVLQLAMGIRCVGDDA